MKSICFVAINIYPLLNQQSAIDFIGGAELQQLLIGTELCKRGYAVTYITMDHGQGLATKIGSFNVIATFKPSEGIPILRFFYPRLAKIWRALCLTDSDIYYVRCAGFLLAMVVFFAHVKGKKVIFCGANDFNFHRYRVRLPTLRDKLLYFWGLRRCDAVIVQNTYQKELLRRFFNKDGNVIHNGLPPLNGLTNSGEIILWVGNICGLKNPGHFLMLAKMFPGERFVMVGGRFAGQHQLYEFIKKGASEIPNLEFKGFLPLNKVENLFNYTKILTSTSGREGFPNTFLQAWRRGIPVMTYVDPDNIIKDFKLGTVVKGYEDLVIKFKEFLDNKGVYSREEIKRYFDENLVIDKQVDKYEKLFNLLEDK